MNDYKDLIGDIGDCLISHPSETVCKRILREAADTIERLVKERNASVDALKAIVENIDAEPVRHGHWVAKKVMARTPFAINHYCSKRKFETDFCTIYCSNCGAKMDEVSE